VLGEYVQRILRARVYDVAAETPLEVAPILSRTLGNEVLLKREDLQSVFSFKLRGAYNKLVSLGLDTGCAVVTASAGNHAQGVALGARKLGLRALIFMPTTTPEIKVEAVRARGGEVMLYGDNYDAACARALEVAAAEGLEFIHPYDDPEVIAGQGTIGVEILRQSPHPIDALFVPVGGGGLMAGVAAYVKYVSPKTRLIAVEPQDSACLAAALEAGEPVTLDRAGIFADGVSVRRIGDETFRVLRETVDEVVTVDSDEICAAIKDIFDDSRSVAEPAGALALAGLKHYARKNALRDQRLVAIETGANMNFDRLRHVAERAEVGEAREAILAVAIPERPGTFLKFCRVLGKLSVTEFNYRYAGGGGADIFVGVQLSSGAEERVAIIDRLEDADFPVTDLTDDEMAKLHIRFMVGGRAPAGMANEQLFRVQFPERPGAMLEFLTHMVARWNISLFHYRNHGAAWGRVLVGFQVPTEELDECRARLDELGYFYELETDNPAYRRFLS
jgi:threonine dehydratase